MIIPYDVVFKGEVNIDGKTIPVEYKMVLIAENDTDAHNKAYDIAKKAYLTWDFSVK